MSLVWLAALAVAAWFASPSLKAVEAPIIGGLEGHPKISPRLGGGVLISELSCAACHSPETDVTGSVPLGPLEEKYSLASLTAFLEDPLAVRPGGRMPASRLDHFEAADIASSARRERPRRGAVIRAL